MQEEQEKQAGGEEEEAASILSPSEIPMPDDAPVMSLEDQLAEAEQKRVAMQDALLRAKAEMENVRRRAQEEVSKAHKFAVESFAESLLPVKDSLETTLKLEAPSLESIREGVEMTLRQLTQVFEKNKITAIVPEKGEKLDPMKHQAISTAPADQEPNTVVHVLQKGYLLADRLVRPAIVIVSAAKAP
ncbi:MAG: nucleotide exchange factor GrpE [Burkholderiaceae bacterium]|nr:nucleotide exchange factor GrpE [Burkholderiaceae bacterium]